MHGMFAYDNELCVNKKPMPMPYELCGHFYIYRCYTYVVPTRIPFSMHFLSSFFRILALFVEATTRTTNLEMMVYQPRV